MSHLVEVARFFDPEEAYCADALLRARGVYSMLQNQHHLTVAPTMRVALGGYKLTCPSAQAELARNELEAAKGQETYPQNEIIRSNEEHLFKTNWLWLPTMLYVIVPFVPVYRTKSMLAFQFFILSLFLADIFLNRIWWIWYQLFNPIE